MNKPTILIVNTAQDKKYLQYARSIESLLAECKPLVIHYSDIKTAEDIVEYGGVILSGQPVADRSHTAAGVKEDYPWVQDVQVPMIGFCGGHQIIALSYGAHLIKNKEAEPKGFYSAYVRGYYINKPIFAHMQFGRSNSLVVYNKHRDSVTLPEGFELLASTDLCNNAMMKHATKQIYGTQFHPDDPDYYRRKQGLNLDSEQGADRILINFESLVINQA